jgi:uncharacterized protein YjiS (DUF1127 family)
MPYDANRTLDWSAGRHAMAVLPLVAPRPGLSALWRLWRLRQRERREAASWTDRDLHDLGLTRGDLWRELHRPLGR